MSFKRENCIYILLLILAFLLGGFFHVAFYGVEFLDCICQIYYSTLAIIWGIAIQKRVTDKRIRDLLLATVGLMILVFVLQMCRYKLLGDDLDAIRYAWYLYYVPVMIVPCILYQIALCVGMNSDEYPKSRWNIFVCAGAVILLALVLSNDIHQFVFRFPEGINQGYYVYSYGIGIYLIYVWIMVIYIASLVIILKKCKVMAAKRLAWIPLSLAIIGGIGEILVVAGLLKYDGIKIWQTGEFFFFWVAGFEEACIAIGLIPANVGYKKLLELTNKPIIITDDGGEVAYKSSKVFELIEDNDNVLMFTNDISGGKVSWAVDMSKIFKLNRQIEETTEQIETRNEYLHTENDLKAEQSKINARNDLYDTMAQIVSPQIAKIKTLLEAKDDSEFDRNLREISVLNVYIKRRSNMELLRDAKDALPLEELSTAINESCEYIKLCGAETMVSPVTDRTLAAKSVIAAYDFFEEVIEASLKSLKSVFVTIACSDGNLRLRLMINADSLDTFKIADSEGKVTVSKEGSDMVLTLMLNIGGDE